MDLSRINEHFYGFWVFWVTLYVSLSGIKHPWEPGVGGALRYRAPEFKGLRIA